MTRTLYDAAYPPADPRLDVCGFYIGGDTPHVWSDAEIIGQSARWRLPIYTCDNPGSRNASSDAAEAIAWLHAHQVPAGCAVALDYETAVNAAYVTTFDRAIRAAGWTTLLYGSLSTVTQNPRPSAGYWTASWTGRAHLDSGAAATQWASDTQLGKPYDLSEVTDTLVLWDTQAPTTQGAQEMEQTDQLIGFDAPAGRTVGNALCDLLNFRDWWYDEIGVADGANPPDNNSRAAVMYLAVQDIASKVDALAAPAVDPTAVATQLAGNPQFVAALAHALAVELRNDLPKS